MDRYIGSISGFLEIHNRLAQFLKEIEAHYGDLINTIEIYDNLITLMIKNIKFCIITDTDNSRFYICGGCVGIKQIIAYIDNLLHYFDKITDLFICEQECGDCDTLCVSFNAFMDISIFINEEIIIFEFDDSSDDGEYIETTNFDKFIEKVMGYLQKFHPQYIKQHDIKIAIKD